MLLYGKIGQEFLNLCVAHFHRMTLIVKKDIALDPVDVGFFSTL